MTLSDQSHRLRRTQVSKGREPRGLGFTDRRHLLTIALLPGLAFLGVHCSSDPDLAQVLEPAEQRGDHVERTAEAVLGISICDGGPSVLSCGGVCTSVKEDTRNCGACGVRCARGFDCLGGICLPPEAAHPRAPRSSSTPAPVGSGGGPTPLGLTSWGTWTARGPHYGGRLDGITATAEADPTLLVGSPGGGVWRRRESALTWTFPLGYGWSDYTVVHLERDITNASRFYMQTWNGLYATTNLGDNWTPLVGQGGAPAGLLPVSGIPDPRPFTQGSIGSGSTLVLTSRPCWGLYYSFDGSTFTQHYPFSGGSTNEDNCIGSFAIDTTAQRVYFSTLKQVPGETAHVFRSTCAWSAGSPCLTWEPVQTGLPSYTVARALAFVPGSAGTDRMLTISHPSSQAEIHELPTGATGWTLRGTFATSGDERAFVWPGGNNLFLATYHLGYSSNLGLGTSFAHYFDPSEHVDVRGAYVDPAFSRVYAVNDGSSDLNNQWNITRWTWLAGGAPFGEANVGHAGLSTWQAYVVGVIPPASTLDPRRAFIGSQDNGIVCTDDAGASGFSISGTFGAGDLFSVQYAPSNPNRAYALSNEGVYRTDDARVGCSYPYTHWVAAGAALSITQYARGVLTVDPVDQTRLYAALTSGVGRSTDGGVTFPLRVLPGNVQPTAVYADAANVVYAGTLDHGIYRSSDGGDTWSAWGLNTGSPKVVMAFASSGGSTPTVWAATTSGLYRRLFAGSWTGPFVGGGGYVVSDVAVDPACPTRVYAALGFAPSRQYHRGGVQVTTDNGATWDAIAVGTGLHQGPVADIEVDALNPRYLYAASYGSGLWTYDWGATGVPTCQP